MRRAITSLLVGIALVAEVHGTEFQDEVKAHHWRVLDSRPCARTFASWLTLPTTPAQFRMMQRKYRSRDFDLWAARLRQVKPGMTEKQVLAILRPKQEPVQMSFGSGFYDSIVLDDAYFADVYFSDWPHRVTGATPPLAISYEINEAKAK